MLQRLRLRTGLAVSHYWSGYGAQFTAIGPIAVDMRSPFGRSANASGFANADAIANQL